jgi:hypothetical protein
VTAISGGFRFRRTAPDPNVVVVVGWPSLLKK